MIFKDIKNIFTSVTHIKDLLDKTIEQVLLIKTNFENLKHLESRMKDLDKKVDLIFQVQKEIKDRNDQFVSHSMKIQDDFMTGVNSVLGQ